MTYNPKALADSTVSLAHLSLLFGRTNRATFHEDGVTPESDTDHTVMLGLTACSLAHSYAPELDTGKIAQLAIVHDLVEVYAGDIATARPLSPEQQKEKALNEHSALERIKKEFAETMPWIHTTIEEYERKDTPEARFVKVIDRLMAKVNHILTQGASLRALGFTRKEFEEMHPGNVEWGRERLQEWPDLIPFWEEILARCYTDIKL